MITLNSLPKRDLTSLLDFIHETLYCNTKEDLIHLIKKLGDLLPYEYNTCVFRRKEILSGNESYEVLNINYPDEWLEQYISCKYNLIDPIIKENFSKFGLQYWADTYKLLPPPKDFLGVAEDFGLKKGYTHGVRNPTGTESSLFSFSGRTIEHDLRTEVILTHIAPHLHQVLVRVNSLPVAYKKVRLTHREKEVLKWLSRGKSSWDISIILSVSERTINFHVSSIMQKLDAVNRAHAVAIGFEVGLVDID